MASKPDSGDGNSDATDDEDPVPVKKMRWEDDLHSDSAVLIVPSGAEIRQIAASSEANIGNRNQLQSVEEVSTIVDSENGESNIIIAEQRENTDNTTYYPTIELSESDQSNQSCEFIREFADESASRAEMVESVANSNQDTVSSIGSNSNNGIDKDAPLEIIGELIPDSTVVVVDSTDSATDDVAKNSDESNQPLEESNKRKSVIVDLSSDSEGADIGFQSIISMPESKKVERRFIRIMPRQSVALNSRTSGKSLLKVSPSELPLKLKSGQASSLLKFSPSKLPIQLKSGNSSYTMKLVPVSKLAKLMPSGTMPKMLGITKATQIQISKSQPSPQTEIQQTASESKSRVQIVAKACQIQNPSSQPSVWKQTPQTSSESKSRVQIVAKAAQIQNPISQPSVQKQTPQTPSELNEVIQISGASGKQSIHHQPGAQLVKTVPTTVIPSSDVGSLASEGGNCLIKQLIVSKNNPTPETTALISLVLKGRPCPVLRMNKCNESDHHSEYTSEYFYENFPWLTGSSALNVFCCLPCLVFGPHTLCYATWNPTCYAKTVLTSVLNRHEMMGHHLEACLLMKTREKEKDSSNQTADCKKMVRKNRNFFKLLVEVVCTVKKKRNNMYTSHLDCVELINLMSCYDSDLKDYLMEVEKSKIGLNDLVSSFVGGVLGAVERHITSKILSELNEAAFVCLILEDTSEVVDKSWIAVIVRYVSENGEIFEKFVRFVEVGFDRTLANMFPLFKNVVSALNCAEKLVAFTYGGTFIEPTDMAEFNETISSEFPSARFFHYKEHNLRRLICQFLSHLKYTREFFQCISDFAEFFMATPNVMKIFIDIEPVVRDQAFCENWNFSSGFIITVNNLYASIVKFLMQIIASPNDWTSESSGQAPYFLSFLRKIQTRFFIVLLCRIFSAVASLTEEMECNADVERWMLLTKRATVNLFELKHYGYDEIVKIASSNSLTKDGFTDGKSISEINRRVYKKNFDEIIDFVATIINNRNKGVTFPKCISSMDSIMKATDNENSSPKFDLLITDIMKIDKAKLKAQTSLFLHNKFFKNKSIIQSIQSMREFTLYENMPELYKMLRLLATIPIASFDTYQNPAIKRVKNYIIGKTELNSVDALMWIERETVEKLQEDHQFYEHVIDIFAKNCADVNSMSLKLTTPGEVPQ